MSQPVNHFYEFGPFRLDPTERVLLRDNRTVTLTPKLFDTLLTLVENGGHIIGKDELMSRVWPDTFVDENTLTRTVSRLRSALGEGTGQSFIETIPRRGYRFVADVRKLPDTSAGLMIERHTRSHLIIQETETSRQDEIGKAFDKPFAPSRAVWQSSKIAMAVLLVMATAALVYFVIPIRSRTSHTATGVKSIAVLPFKTLGAQEADEYVRIGLADALITRLGGLKQITVRPTSAVQKFAGNDQDPVAAGRALGVDAVLDGRVQKLGDRIRVTVQLVNTRDGSPLWTDKFDGKLTNIFAVQDSISSPLAQSIRSNLTGEEKEHLAKHYSDNSEAYEAYLKGRFFLNKRTSEGVRKSTEYFQEAVEKDPSFALAYSGLADAYSIGDAPRADAALRRALQLDDSLGEAHASLGFNRMFYGWDWATAEQEFQRAIELNPNYASARQWYAIYLAARSRTDEAKEMMREAIQIDPLSPNINADLGQMHYFAHEYDEAIHHCRKALELDPNFQPAHEYLYYTYAQKGLYDEAVEEYLIHNAQDDTPTALGAFKQAYKASGWSGFLRTILKYRATRDHHAILAIISVQLGDRERAIAELERAYDAVEFFLTFIKTEPAYDNLRADPRFQDLLRRIGLAE